MKRLNRLLIITFAEVLVFSNLVFSQFPITITGFSPTNGTQTAPVAVTISCYLNFIGGIKLYIDNQIVNTNLPSGPGNVQITTPVLTIGSHDIMITKSDGSGTAMARYVINDPPTPPSVHITYISPGSGSAGAPVSANVFFDSNLYQASSGTYKYYVDDLLTSTAPASTGSNAWTTPPLIAGTHTLKIEIISSNGSNSDTRSYVVNVGPPTATITSVTPASGTLTAPANVTVNYTIDQPCTVYYYGNLFPDGPHSVSAGNNSFSLLSLTPGIHAISIFSYNANGNKTTSIDYNVIEGPPIAITSISPESGTGLAPVNATINCYLSKPGNLSLYVDGACWLNPGQKPMGYAQMIVPNLPIGTHTITAKLFVSEDDAVYSSNTINYVVNGPIPTISLSTTHKNVDWSSGSTSFTISNSGTGILNWNATSSDPSWLTVSPASGTNSGTVTVNYTAYWSPATRTGTVTVNGTDASNSPQTITVTQQGVPLISGPSILTLGYLTGSTSFSISNGGVGTLNWSVTSPDTSWLTVNPSTGTNSGTVVVNYSANTSLTPKTGIMTITAPGAISSPYRFTITQVGAPPPKPHIGVPQGYCYLSTQNSIRIQWFETPGATSYTLHLSTDSTSSDITTDVQACTVEGLMSNHTYYCSITAHNASGSSPSSDTWSFITMPPTPPTPQLLSPENGYTLIQNSVALNWSPSEGATSYTVHWTDGSASSDFTTASTSYTVTGLQSNHHYTWYVFASNLNGSSPSTETRSITKDPTPAEISLSPQNLNVGYLPGTISFNISNPGESPLQWSLISSNPEWLTVTPSNGTNNGTITVSYILNGNSVPRTGTLTMTGIGAVNSPQYVTVTQAKAEAPIVSIVEIIPATGLQAAPAAATVNYNIDQPVTQYFIFSDGIEVGGGLIPLSEGNHSHQISFYTPGSHSIHIDVGNANGLGATDETYFVHVPPPALIWPFDNSTNVPKTPTVMWRRPLMDAVYSVQVSTNISFEPAFIVFDRSDITTTECLISNLNNDTTYYWRVLATTESAGASTWSVPYSFRTIIAPPDAPQLSIPIDGYATYEGSVTLNWLAPLRAESYIVHWTDGSTTSDFTTSSTSYPITGLQNNHNYTWAVTATNNISGSGLSSEVRSITKNPTPPVISLSTNSLNVGYLPGTTSFDITNTGESSLDWTVSSDRSWLKVNPMSETNNGNVTKTVTITYELNNYPVLREGTITVNGTGVANSPQYVTVTQAKGEVPIVTIAEFTPMTGTIAAPATVTVKYIVDQPVHTHFYLDDNLDNEIYGRDDQAGNKSFEMNLIKAGMNQILIKVSNGNGLNAASAIYEVLSSISTSSNPPEAGTTDGRGTYHYGSQATVSAAHATGYTFTNWTENDIEVSTIADYTFTVIGDRTLVAHFSPPPSISLGVISPKSGTIKAPAIVKIPCSLSQRGLISLSIDDQQVETEFGSSPVGPGNIDVNTPALSVGNHKIEIKISNTNGSNSEITNYVVISTSFYTSYTYDQAGRLSSVSSSLNEDMSDATTEATYEYFASGNVKQLVLGSNPVETITYKYNERDWLTDINNVEAAVPNIFAEKLDYFTNVPDALKQFNGNIAQARFYSGHDPSPKIGYQFAYDGANRLTSAQTLAGDMWSVSNNYNLPAIDYDANGNITSLQRNGQNAALIDNLSYHYESGNNNKLTSITNHVGNTTQTYQYDNNGNVTADSYHELNNITYNVQNLPKTLTKSGSTINYWYDAQGNRIRKQTTENVDEHYIIGAGGETEAVTDANGTVKFWSINAGSNMIGRVEQGRKHYYYLKDHLGSIRATIDQAGYKVSYDDYDPWGLQLAGRSGISGNANDKFKFTGKERDKETVSSAAQGYDYFGARYYDSRIGRWMSVDPLAEKYPNLNAYNYTANNPIIFIDPDGKGLDLPGGSQQLKAKLQNPIAFSINQAATDIHSAAVAFLRGDIIGGLKADASAVFNATVGLVTNLDPVGFSPAIITTGAEAALAKTISTENAAQSANLNRFESKLPTNASETTIRDLPNGGKAFQAEVPAKNIPGSKAVYEKQVSNSGKTLEYTKTTYDNNGNIVHVKDKIRNITIKPEDVK